MKLPDEKNAMRPVLDHRYPWQSLETPHEPPPDGILQLALPRPTVLFPPPRVPSILAPVSSYAIDWDNIPPTRQSFVLQKDARDGPVLHLFDPATSFEYWDYSGPEEVVAGMYAAIKPILIRLNRPNDAAVRISGVEVTPNFTRQMVSEAAEEETLNYRPKSGWYGLWLKGSDIDLYDFYVFKTAAFVQGILSACEAFGEDFRDYLFNFPFDAAGTTYMLQGYVMAGNLTVVDAEDYDDTYAEEVDNEKIIEPLSKDW